MNLAHGPQFAVPCYIIKVELSGYLYCRINLKSELLLLLLLSFTTFPNGYFLFFTKDYILNGKDESNMYGCCPREFL